jgi:glycosyltransferase involved in cell wall biosynthesis
LKINFILPFSAKTGGVVVVLEHARQLRKMGHDVWVYHPIIPYVEFFHEAPFWKRWFQVARLTRSNFFQRGGEYGWFPGNPQAVSVPSIKNRYIRDADIVIATAWPTAYSVAKLSPSKGTKYYFIQHYEVWSGKSNLVEGSYRLPLQLLTIAPWLTELMKTKFNRRITGEIHNGIDLERFFPTQAERPETLTILMLHHEVAFKGVADGLSVLRRIHAAFPEIQIRLFGMHPFPEKEPWMDHVQNPSPEALLALYQQADIYLAPSLKEGWHLPPMEAMACGCAVVATRVGCIPVLESDGNLLSAEPGDVEGLFQHLDSLVRNPDLLRATARKGRETILKYGWENKSRDLEKVLNDGVGMNTPSI